jgi:ADP-ribose pyrophosphatase YjhB (NUDIX family)
MNEGTYRFCPSCGGALEARLLRPGEPHRLVCTQCGFILYLDPKVAVGTIIRTDDGRIVLVRRAIEPGYGLWVFPGGYVDRGEQVTAAAIREAREEAGLDVRLDGLVNIYSYPGVPLVVIVYAASILGGELCTDEECLEAGLFEAGDIPWPALAFRSTHDGLTDYLAGRVHPIR